MVGLSQMTITPKEGVHPTEQTVASISWTTQTCANNPSSRVQTFKVRPLRIKRKQGKSIPNANCDFDNQRLLFILRQKGKPILFEKMADLRNDDLPNNANQIVEQDLRFLGGVGLDGGTDHSL